MTDKKTEALKLALEALEDAKKNHGLVYVTELCAIREALAEQQAQQHTCPFCEVGKTYGIRKCMECGSESVPGSLHDQNVDEMQPAQQEPVAWKDRTYGNLHHQDFGNSIPLYTSPPASKPWVGLTDEEKTEIRRETYALPMLLMEAIEAKLKEKNT